MIAKFQQERSTMVVILLVGLLIPSGYIAYWFTNTSSTAILQFEEKQAILLNTAKDLAEKSFEQGAGANTNRQVLHVTLEQVLVSPISDPERLTLAEKGASIVSRIQTDIDSLQETHVALSQESLSLASLIPKIRRPSDVEKAETLLTDLSTVLTLTETILTAHTQMNAQSAQIFERIIADNGALTPEHIRDINTTVGDAETNFDSLGEAYQELRKLLEIPPSPLSQ